MQTAESTQRMAHSRQQAADALSLSLRTLDKMLANGTIRGVRLGRRVVVPHDEIKRVLKEGVE